MNTQQPQQTPSVSNFSRHNIADDVEAIYFIKMSSADLTLPKPAVKNDSAFESQPPPYSMHSKLNKPPTPVSFKNASELTPTLIESSADLVYDKKSLEDLPTPSTPADIAVMGDPSLTQTNQKGILDKHTVSADAKLSSSVMAEGNKMLDEDEVPMPLESGKDTVTSPEVKDESEIADLGAMCLKYGVLDECKEWTKVKLAETYTSTAKSIQKLLIKGTFVNPTSKYDNLESPTRLAQYKGRPDADHAGIALVWHGSSIWHRSQCNVPVAVPFQLLEKFDGMIPTFAELTPHHAELYADLKPGELLIPKYFIRGDQIVLQPVRAKPAGCWSSMTIAVGKSNKRVIVVAPDSPAKGSNMSDPARPNDENRANVAWDKIKPEEVCITANGTEIKIYPYCKSAKKGFSARFSAGTKYCKFVTTMRNPISSSKPVKVFLAFRAEFESAISQLPEPTKSLVRDTADITATFKDLVEILAQSLEIDTKENIDEQDN
ncbi:uncharacterized protein RAG0_14630 [Rhynchosporium agropyri]|uniref:Uncharacterized protein n=1 Tax=Rhynchosporium agropyri TaxID=914238 RepID=A0A1E1LHN8_9HELO|nr:uncharacterized protein RAG0_14630 [Rhynchosporium agropyri]